jgi:hypothetical protein
MWPCSVSITPCKDEGEKGDKMGAQNAIIALLYTLIVTWGNSANIRSTANSVLTGTLFYRAFRTLQISNLNYLLKKAVTLERTNKILGNYFSTPSKLSCCLLCIGFLPGLLINPELIGDTFLRNNG